MNVKLLSVQWGFKPRLNEVKASADATDLKGSLSSELDKIWAQIRRGVFDSWPINK